MGESKRKVRFTTTRHVVTPCLNCGEKLDASTMVGPGGETATPGEGDMTICLRCRHIMTYRADLSLRELTDAEIVEVAGHQKLVSMIDLLGAYAAEKNLEARRRSGRQEAGDEEVSRQVRRAAGRAAIAYLKAHRRSRSRPE